MSLADEHDAGMAEILADAGVVFTWQGADYACIHDASGQSKPNEEGGFLEDYDITIVSRVALFSTLPQNGQTIIQDGVTYRIAKVSTNFSNTIFTINGIALNK
jgi:hypothetical protein